MCRMNFSTKITQTKHEPLAVFIAKISGNQKRLSAFEESTQPFFDFLFTVNIFS